MLFWFAPLPKTVFEQTAGFQVRVADLPANRYPRISEPVSVLMPVFNEAEGIESVLAEFVEVVYRYLPEGSELLIEEGGSTDGTREILRDLELRWPFLNVVYNERKEGFAAAARKLFQRANCPIVLFLDSDGQCVASEFWKLAAQMDGVHCVLGVKRIRYDPFLRQFASRAFNSIARALFGFPFKDINFGFRLFRRDALLQCLAHAKHMPTLLNAEIAIIAYCSGLRMREVVVHHRPRLFGLSRGLEPDSFLKESWKALAGLLKIKREMDRGASEALSSAESASR